MTEPQTPQIPEERRFIWRNLDAFLAGELGAADHARVQAFLRECPSTREYVETEQQFIETMRRCVGETSTPCPEGLRERVLEALNRCELVEQPSRLGFPWLGAGMLAAACLMLAVALVIVFGADRGAARPGLSPGLNPLVQQVSLDAPVSKTCKRRVAQEECRKYFPEAPELPNRLDGQRIKVSAWETSEVDGRPVFSVIYDAEDGERFALLVFSCDCLAAELAQDMQALELQVEGKWLVMWREGGLFRALVGSDAHKLRRHMNELRGAV